jgi:HK97 gp10 family phage protein
MAADRIDYTMEGLPELLGKLDSVTQDIKYKGGRFALRRAAQVIRDQARANASKIDDPKTAESIEKNIVERWNGRLFKRTGRLGFRIGAMGGAGGNKPASAFAGLPGGDTRQAFRQQEFGNSNHAAQPFMRPAVDQAGQQAVDAFINEYGKALDRALRRARKRAGK